MKYYWEKYTKSKLLELRISDLNIDIKTPFIERHLLKIKSELNKSKLPFHPIYWLSTEWFCPDQIAGVAIPFYLAHPRLIELERSIMGSVEGEGEFWMLRYIRHELGHAVDNAFDLRKDRKRKFIFGSPDISYPDSYKPKIYSKKYVRYLPDWYAQAHPDEDFAETFATWFDQSQNWRTKYKNWPVKRKLQYMNTMMNRIKKNNTFYVEKQGPYESIDEIEMTLNQFYKMKKKRYNAELNKIFEKPLNYSFQLNESANVVSTCARNFFNKKRSKIERKVAKQLGCYQYEVKVATEIVFKHLKQNDLILRHDEKQVLIQLEYLVYRALKSSKGREIVSIKM